MDISIVIYIVIRRKSIIWWAIPQFTKTFWSTSIRHLSDTKVPGRCLIDGDPRVFAIGNGSKLMKWGHQMIGDHQFNPQQLHTRNRFRCTKCYIWNSAFRPEENNRLKLRNVCLHVIFIKPIKSYIGAASSFVLKMSISEWKLKARV